MLTLMDQEDHMTYLEQMNTDPYGSGGPRDYLEQRNTDIYGSGGVTWLPTVEQMNTET